ncbi:MAG: enoyl-CoA hydratase/isomerase family protein [Candidatus Binatia bacterium]
MRRRPHRGPGSPRRRSPVLPHFGQQGICRHARSSALDAVHPLQDQVARIWLNRPEQHNPINALALDELISAFDELQRHPEIAVAVLGGRGPSFSAGADRNDWPGLPRAADASAPQRGYTAQLGRRAVQAIERAEAITIAQLHGHVIGGAVLIALACDLRIAARSTRFRIPEVDLGVPLTWGGVPRLAREVGAARARELILLCDAFDAATAERYALVNRVVPDEELDAAVEDWTRRLSVKAPWTLHMTKRQFRAYASAGVLGDVTELDGDLLTSALREDPTRLAVAPKKKATDDE